MRVALLSFCAPRTPRVENKGPAEYWSRIKPRTAQQSWPIASINPAAGEVVKTFEPLTAAQIETKLQWRGADVRHLPQAVYNRRLAMGSPGATTRCQTSKFLRELLFIPGGGPG